MCETSVASHNPITWIKGDFNYKLGADVKYYTVLVL